MTPVDKIKVDNSSRSRGRFPADEEVDLADEEVDLDVAASQHGLAEGQEDERDHEITDDLGHPNQGEAEDIAHDDGAGDQQAHGQYRQRGDGPRSVGQTDDKRA